MLNEKEKQAIEYLKENALVRLNKNNKIVAYGNSYKYYILKLLDKQQKEIERYKRIAEMNLKDGEEFKNEMCEHRCILKSEMKENYISKEAIRNKIKDLESYIYTGENAPQDFLQYRVKAKIQGYKELLGE